MSQEFDVNLDLKEVFSFKKSPTCIPDLSPIENIREYKSTEILKHFQYGEFKTRLKFTK